MTPLLGRLVERGWVTLHGPVVCDLGVRGRFLVGDLRRWLIDGRRRGELHAARMSCLVPGRARGRLAGGCLSVIAASVGTPFAPRLEGTVVLIEEVAEAPYRIDRLLWQLRASGLLSGVRALVFGQMTRCRPAAGRPSRSLREVLLAHAEALGVPAVSGLPVGHGARTRAVPLGADAEVDARRGRVVVRLPDGRR